MTPIPILLYHSVGSTRAPEYRRWCIEPGRFAEHLDALAESGFDFLTVSDYVDALDAGTLPERPLLVTFDDGRADYVEHAVPELDRRGITSTMYVVSGHVGGTSAWLPDATEAGEPMMDWSDLVDVAASHEIGAHSRHHPELDVVATAVARTEIVGSRRDLEDGLGRRVRSFAYPHGYHTAAIVAATREGGFDSACAVHDRWSWVGESRHRLSRLIVDGDTTAEQLVERLARPPAAPERRSGVLRRGWRCVRWVRRRNPIGMHV